LERLDRLTLEESRTTISQTLGVIYGLVNNNQVVMEGAHRFFVIVMRVVLNTSARWQGVDIRHSTDPRCARSTPADEFLFF